MYVLDTNTIIHFFEGRGEVEANLFAKVPSEIGLPTIVLYELQVGVFKSTDPMKRLAQLDVFSRSITILPFTDREAKVSAEIRVELEARGLSIGPLDNLIAGTAMARSATLVSRNVREFGRIGGLRLENWYD